MDKTLVVGDLHGRYELAQKALKFPGKVLFIGDYLDSFDRSPHDQYTTLRTVLDAIDEEPDRVQGLVGNHERSYFVPGNRCSGWKSRTESLVYNLDISSLKEYTWEQGFLVSHAGVSKALLEYYSIPTVQEYLDAGDYSQVGYRRGGPLPCGGLYWCDWFSEFEPVPDVPQIVGHSGYRPRGEHKGIIQNDNSWNVDCFEHVEEYLLVEDGVPRIIKPEDL